MDELKKQRAETMRKTMFKHGKIHTRVYKTWTNMKQRCLNPNSSAYKDYGGRGIKVCDRWLSFENFLDDMGDRPEGMSIDRKGNNGNYEPNNCRWATPKKQNNNRRDNVRIKFYGMDLTLPEWGELLNIKSRTLWMRLNGHGWSIQKTLTTPARRRRAL